MFEQDTGARQIARSLRVSTKSVYQWRRAAAYGWEQDQRRTLALVAALIARLFGVSHALRGVSFLLHRLGFSSQVPAHRAFERDEDAIAAWRSATWAKVRG